MIKYNIYFSIFKLRNYINFYIFLKKLFYR